MIREQPKARHATAHHQQGSHPRAAAAAVGPCPPRAAPHPAAGAPARPQLLHAVAPAPRAPPQSGAGGRGLAVKKCTIATSCRAHVTCSMQRTHASCSRTSKRKPANSHCHPSPASTHLCHNFRDGSLRALVGCLQLAQVRHAGLHLRLKVLQQLALVAVWPPIQQLCRRCSKGHGSVRSTWRQRMAAAAKGSGTV